MAFALLIVYRDGQHKRQRYAKGADAGSALALYSTLDNVAYAQINGPSGLVGRYVGASQ